MFRKQKGFKSGGGLSWGVCVYVAAGSNINLVLVPKAV